MTSLSPSGTTYWAGGHATLIWALGHNGDAWDQRVARLNKANARCIANSNVQNRSVHARQLLAWADCWGAGCSVSVGGRACSCGQHSPPHLRFQVCMHALAGCAVHDPLCVCCAAASLAELLFILACYTLPSYLAADTLTSSHVALRTLAGGAVAPPVDTLAYCTPGTAPGHKVAQFCLDG